MYVHTLQSTLLRHHCRMWLCDNVAFLRAEWPRPCPPTYYLVGPVPCPWSLDHVSHLSPATGNYSCTPVKYARRTPRLPIEHSPAFSVVNPCIVVLAVTVVPSLLPTVVDQALVKLWATQYSANFNRCTEYTLNGLVCTIPRRNVASHDPRSYSNRRNQR